MSELRQDASFGARLLAPQSGILHRRHPDARARHRRQHRHLQPRERAGPQAAAGARAGRSRPHLHRAKARRPGSTIRTSSAQSTVFTDVAAHTGTTRALTLDDTTASMAGETTIDATTSRCSACRRCSVAPTFPRTPAPMSSCSAERTWRTRFGSDPVDRRPDNSRSVDVRSKSSASCRADFAGRAPPGFLSEFWMPIDPAHSRRTLEDRGRSTFEIVARLKPGVSAAQAQAATLVVGQQLAAEYPEARRAARADRSLPHRRHRRIPRDDEDACAALCLRRPDDDRRRARAARRLRQHRRPPARSRRGPAPGDRRAPRARRGPRPPDSSAPDRKPAPRASRRHRGRSSSPSGSAARSTSSSAGFPFRSNSISPLDRRMFVYTLALSLLTAVLCGLAPARSATRMTCRPGAQIAVGEHDTGPSVSACVTGSWSDRSALSCALLLWAGLFARSLSNAHQDRPRIRSGWRSCSAHLQFDDEVTRSGAHRAAAGGTADTHQRAPRRSELRAWGRSFRLRSGAAKKRRMRHGNRPAGPAWPNGARQPRQPRVVSDAADSAAGRTGFQWRGRCRGAACRDRERDAGAAVLEWRARSANGSTGLKSSASCGQQILDARRDQPADWSTRPTTSDPKRK